MILLDFRRKGPSPKRARVVVTRGGRQPPVAAASQSGARSKKRASAAREATVIVNQGSPELRDMVPGDDGQLRGNGAGMAATADVMALRERVAKAEGERDLLLDQLADLRALLDLEAEERRKLTAILTGPRPPWWRRWFR